MDIVTWCNVPRYLHNNLPLGNPLGPPDDRVTQRQSVIDALQLAADASEPVVVCSNVAWPDGDGWLEVYNRVDDSNRELLKKMGEENESRGGYTHVEAMQIGTYSVDLL